MRPGSHQTEHADALPPRSALWSRRRRARLDAAACAPPVHPAPPAPRRSSSFTAGWCSATSRTTTDLRAWLVLGLPRPLVAYRLPRASPSAQIGSRGCAIAPHQRRQADVDVRRLVVAVNRPAGSSPPSLPGEPATPGWPYAGRSCYPLSTRVRIPVPRRYGQPRECGSSGCLRAGRRIAAS